MTKYARTASLFFNTPLLLLPAKAEEIRLFLQTKMAGEHIDYEEKQEPFAVRYFAMDDGFAGAPQDVTAAMSGGSSPSNGAVAVVPLYGVMSQRVSLMQSMSGATSTQGFAAALREQVNNPQVKAVIIDVDSPGGSVYGTDELATEIHSMRDRKPIVAVANSGMFSAAYYAMSNASEVVITPGGELGSVGVIAMHVDQSAALEEAGLKVSLITAGKYKAEGNSFEPLGDEARQEIQSQVDRYYGMFINAVARGREVSSSTVRDRYGQGRVFGAQDAVRLGMADRIATLDDTIQRFASGGRVSRRGSTAEAEERELFMLEGGEPAPFVVEEDGPAYAEHLVQLDRDRLLARRR